jgi:hypothetical protein
MPQSRTLPLKIIFILGLVGVILTSCSSPTATEITTPTSTVVPSPQPASESQTPTPIQEKVILLDSDQSPQTITQTISAVLLELCQAQGWEFIVSKERPVDEIEPGTRVVVTLPPDPGLNSMSAIYQDIQFISIGIPNLQSTSNLNIVGPEGFREDQLAFIAGYVSSILTKDWRSGIINQASSDWRETINQSFSNGMIYYCGLCQLVYPPYYNYPILVPLSQAASYDEWENASALLNSQSVNTVFLYSNELDSTILETLLENGVFLWGVKSPPDTFKNSWIATIRWAPEIVIEMHWEDLLRQNGGWVENIPIVLEDVNETIFSIGKQKWVQEFTDDVIRGYIGTGFDPEIDNP